MVIGNGFFSDTREDALREMEQRSGCKVVKSNLPTVGNIAIYVSERGDLYGQQYIQGKWLTRTKTPERTGIGYVARISDKGKESRIHMCVLVYCAFVSHQWQPDVELEFINGNIYDPSPKNLRPKKHEIVVPKEWTDTMNARTDVYESQFLHVCWSARSVSDTSACTSRATSPRK